MDNSFRAATFILKKQRKLIISPRRAANEAAALARVTQFTLLVFPVLFEEKTAGAVRQAERQARIYSRELIAA